MRKVSTKSAAIPPATTGRATMGFNRGIRACVWMLKSMSDDETDHELSGWFRHRGLSSRSLPQDNAVLRVLRQILDRGDADELEGFCACLTNLAFTADQEPGANTGDRMYEAKFAAFADHHERVLGLLAERGSRKEVAHG